MIRFLLGTILSVGCQYKMNREKRMWCYYIAIFCFSILFSGCTGNSERENRQKNIYNWMQERDKKKILCTTPMVADLVNRIGGDTISCLTLIHGEQDPHSYQLVKGDDEKIKAADLIFFSGLGLEHGPSLAYQLEKSPQAFSLGNHLLQIDPKKIIYIDNVPDPHIWMDVSLWKEAVPFIVQVLANILPECKDAIKKNGLIVEQELETLHQKIFQDLQAIPEQKRYLVTTHDAFNYFTRAYLAEADERASNRWQQRCQAPEGLAPDSQLSTVDIQRLTEYLVRYNISTIFAEANVSRDSIKKLIDSSRKNGHEVHIAPCVLFADSVGKIGSDTDSYMKMIQYDAHVLAKELK